MNKTAVKTFYSYDIPDNKKLMNGLHVTLGLSFLGFLIFFVMFVTSFSSPQSCFLFLLLCVVLGIICANVFMARQFFNKVFNGASIVAHDWGLETSTDGLKENIKWQDMIKLEKNNKKFCFIISQVEYVVKYNGGSFTFYSSLENVNFLENFIRKNLNAEKSKDLNLNWSHK